MAKIRFNQNFGIDMPTLVLERRDFSKIGILSDISDVEYRETLQAPELSFTVRKTEPSVWEHINNYNLFRNTENIFHCMWIHRRRPVSQKP